MHTRISHIILRLNYAICLDLFYAYYFVASFLQLIEVFEVCGPTNQFALLYTFVVCCTIADLIDFDRCLYIISDAHVI